MVTRKVAGVSAFNRPASPTVKLPGLRFSAQKERVQLDQKTVVDQVEIRRRKGHILVPDGTPVYFLHGTFSNSDSLQPMVNWVANDLVTNHPRYVSYVPEIDQATGIETVKKHRFRKGRQAAPAYQMVLRDMGDYRVQLIRNNLMTLDARLKEWEQLPRKEQDRRIAEYFRVLGPMRDKLVPVIRKHVLSPLDKAPEDLAKQKIPALKDLIAKADAKLQREIRKIVPEGDGERNIHDTAWFRFKAEANGLTLNTDMGKVIDKPDVINMRSVNFQDIARIEGYLLGMRENLGKALFKVFAGNRPVSAERKHYLEKRARNTAVKLMDHIAPRGLAFGHSQGGTVLVSALMNHLARTPQVSAEALAMAGKPFNTLSGGFVGLGVFFNSPLRGIPDEPVWGKKLIEEIAGIEKKLPLIRRRPGMTGRAVKRVIWQAFLKGRPAIREMRQDSELAKKFREDLSGVAGRDLTLISASDAGDMFVEPEACLLADERGKTPANVFNVTMKAQQVEPGIQSPDELVESALSIFGKPVARLARKLPPRLKEYFYKSYLENFVSIEQHSAMVSLPYFVERELGRNMIARPDNQQMLLDTGNFEPVRYQSLVARGRSYRKHVLEKPTPEAAAGLNQFVNLYPRFIDALIDNAREAIPLENSASNEAYGILRDTVNLMEGILEERTLRKQYAPKLYKYLHVIAGAYLEPPCAGEESISSRAQDLLTRWHHFFLAA